MHVIGLHGDRIRPPGISSAICRRLVREAHVGGGHLRLQLDLDRSGRSGTAARLRRRRRRAPPDTSATAAGDRRAQDERVAGGAPPPLRSVSSRCASRAFAAAVKRASAPSTARARVLDASRRNGALGEQPLGARQLGRAASTAACASATSRPARRGRPPSDSRGSSRPSSWPAPTRSPTAGRLVDMKRPSAGAETIASPPVSGSITAGTRSPAARRLPAPERWRSRSSTAVPSNS